jgi:integrase/recombinase XerD
MVVKARARRKLPEVLSGREVDELLRTLRRPAHHALASLCYGAGLRVGEACGLKAKHVDSKRMIIHVHDGKGGKDRQVPLGRRLLLVLRRYYRVVRPRPPYLFPGRGERPHLSKAAFQKALQVALRQTGITKRVTPHVLRHSYATHLIEAGADLRSVQLLLGHASLRSTTTYVHLTRARFEKLPSPLDMLGTKEGEGLG